MKRSLAVWLFCCACVLATGKAWPTELEQAPSWQAYGLRPEQQEVQYWLARTDDAERVLLTPAQIASRNRWQQHNEQQLIDWPRWPTRFTAAQIRARIEALSRLPAGPLYDAEGRSISQARRAEWLAALDLPGIDAGADMAFGLAVSRADLRRFPTTQRVFNTPDDTDIDRFQESALMLGSVVAVLHASRDGQWLFVQSDNYAAWVAANAIALTSRAEALRYAAASPRRWITGASARLAHVPSQPALSGIPLDMGMSYPELAGWPIGRAVHGQGVLSSWVLQVPWRDATGRLLLQPALLPRSSDSAASALPLNRANLIRQSFKFQGERYGWGHDYQARDCSGFVSEVYRSMGLLLPRNTSDQARTGAFRRIAFDPDWNRERRSAELRKLEIGDLVFIPGHVMLVIGNDAQGPWVIHDSHKTGLLHDGRYLDLPTNTVAVTPLLAMAFSAERRYVDAVTAVQRILPAKP